MSVTAEQDDEVLRRAFSETKKLMIERRPAFGLLSTDSSLWRWVREKLSEGYANGIVLPEDLADYVWASLPNTRKFDHN